MAWRIFLTFIACGSMMACNSDNANAVKVNTTPEPIQSESVEVQAVDNNLSESESLTQSAPESECDLESVNLLDFVPWQREEGWWVGEYTFLGADGDPNVSASWPYL